MNRFRWANAILFLLVAAHCAYADSSSTFSITGATVFVGAGQDNASFVLTGPGTNILGYGGYACQFAWCDPEEVMGETFARGSFLYLQLSDGTVFVDFFDTVKIGGQDFDPETLSLNSLTLNILGGITFPTNPAVSGFTACVPAVMSGPISGSVGNGVDFTNFVLRMPPGGKFCSTWSFIPASPGSPAGFQFSQGQFVGSTIPEPSTIAFMVSGLAGIVGALGRKRDRRCSPN